MIIFSIKKPLVSVSLDPSSHPLKHPPATTRGTLEGSGWDFEAFPKVMLVAPTSWVGELLPTIYPFPKKASRLTLSRGSLGCRFSPPKRKVGVPLPFSEGDWIPRDLR